MVKILAGKEGTGKTKHLIRMANEQLKTTPGSIVYLDSDNRHIYELKHEIRFLNMNEYPIKNSDAFVGFLCGVISNNHDIQSIYVDGLYNMVDMNEVQALACIDQLEKIADTFDIEFKIGMNYKGIQVPEGIQKYIFEVEESV